MVFNKRNIIKRVNPPASTGPRLVSRPDHLRARSTEARHRRHSVRHNILVVDHPERIRRAIKHPGPVASHGGLHAVVDAALAAPLLALDEAP